jgi:hypothetical protein
MLVRDLAIAIHDTCKFLEHVEVVLCDGETRKPLKGKQWLLPNSAVFVALVENDLKRATKKNAAQVDDDKSVTQEHIHILVDCVQLPDGRGAGGFKGMADNDGCIQTRSWPAGQTLSAMERQLVAEAVEDVKTKFDSDTVRVIAHVYTTSLQLTKAPPEGIRMQWLPMDSPELLRIRKFSVRKHLISFASMESCAKTKIKKTKKYS